VGSEDDIDPGRAALDLRPVLLRQATTDCDLHVRSFGLDRPEPAKVAVELVVGVLTHRAGVEHHDVGNFVARRAGLETGLLQQSRQPFGVMDVHLTPVGAYLIGPSRTTAYRVGTFERVHHDDQPTAAIDGCMLCDGQVKSALQNFRDVLSRTSVCQAPVQYHRISRATRSRRKGLDV